MWYVFIKLRDGRTQRLVCRGCSRVEMTSDNSLGPLSSTVGDVESYGQGGKEEQSSIVKPLVENTKLLQGFHDKKLKRDHLVQFRVTKRVLYVIREIIVK